MMKPFRLATCLAVAVVLAAGCAGDMTKQLVSDPNLQAQVMDLISGNGGMAGQMADRLLASDSTRSMVIDKLLASGEGAQGVLVAVARNTTALDGVIGLAVQDPATRDHLMTLFRGMEMAGGK